MSCRAWQNCRIPFRQLLCLDSWFRRRLYLLAYLLCPLLSPCTEVRWGSFSRLPSWRYHQETFYRRPCSSQRQSSFLPAFYSEPPAVSASSSAEILAESVAATVLLFPWSVAHS